MAEAARHLDGGQQLALYDTARRGARPLDVPRRPVLQPRLCAGCRAGEARYGFRIDGEENPLAERPRTLCFECFRVEIGRRQLVAARLATGWNAQQVQLPLEERLRTLSLRRRRAQIAARKVLEGCDGAIVRRCEGAMVLEP